MVNAASPSDAERRERARTETVQPVNLLTGFLSKEGKAHGRPTMLTVMKDGSLLVSDDVGNIVWRVTAAAPAAAGPAKS